MRTKIITIGLVLFFAIAGVGYGVLTSSARHLASLLTLARSDMQQSIDMHEKSRGVYCQAIGLLIADCYGSSGSCKQLDALRSTFTDQFGTNADTDCKALAESQQSAAVPKAQAQTLVDPSSSPNDPLFRGDE